MPARPRSAARVATVPIDIRTLRSEEAPRFVRAVMTSFLQPPPTSDARASFWLERLRPDLDRTWAAFDGERVVGTLRTLPFELTVPGGRVLPADGVTAVTVAPTHRFTLDAGPDGAECAPTTRSADLTLPATALASAYLGGTRLATLAEAGLVDEHRPGGLAAADRLLAGDLVPYCPLHF